MQRPPAQAVGARRQPDPGARAQGPPHPGGTADSGPERHPSRPHRALLAALRRRAGALLRAGRRPRALPAGAERLRGRAARRRQRDRRGVPGDGGDAGRALPPAGRGGRLADARRPTRRRRPTSPTSSATRSRGSSSAPSRWCGARPRPTASSRRRSGCCGAPSRSRRRSPPRWPRRRRAGRGSAAGASRPLYAGSCTVIVVPRPASLSTSIRPPQLSTSRFTIASPSPDPLVVVENRGSKIRGSSSGGIPVRRPPP